jgi:ATP/maltotriose-dependent transcriptional regulator MalT
MVWALAYDDLDRARAAFSMGLEWTRQQGSEGDLGLLKGVIAQIDAWRGDYEAADAGVDEAVELARLGGSPMTLADALRVRASIDAYRDGGPPPADQRMSREEIRTQFGV